LGALFWRPVFAIYSHGAYFSKHFAANLRNCPITDYSNKNEKKLQLYQKSKISFNRLLFCAVVHSLFNVLPERKAAFGEGSARLIEDQTIRTVLLGNLPIYQKKIIKARLNKRDSLLGFILLL
jgi:hypothetical protein